MYDNKRSVTKKLKYGLIAAALTVSLAAALPVWTVGQAQAAPDLTAGGCSLTIERASETKQGNVVVDLYKIASAEPLTGYDTYQLTLEGEYAGFEDELNTAMDPKRPGEAGANTLYRELAQKIARQVLLSSSKNTEEGETASASTTSLTPAKTVNLSENSKISGLDPGMYLVIAHGKGLTPAQYTTNVTEEGTGAQKLATVAYANEYVYTYLPELVALPMKVSGVGGAAPDPSAAPDAPEGSFGTADEGDWVNHVTIELKSEESLALAGLLISKTFQVPEGTVVSDREGCVYQIEATLGGETVYSNVVALKYDGSAAGSVRLEKIVPVGAEITVTEVYDGAGFQAEGAVVKTIGSAVADDGDVINNNVFFVNIANGNGTGGDIVTNSFTDEGDSGWHWNNQPAAPQQ